MNSPFFSKLWLIVAVSAMMASAIAADPKSGLEVVGGVNMDTQTNNIPFATMTSGIGYQVGGLYNFALDRKLIMSTGAVYRVNMAKVNVLGLDMDAKTSFVEVPVNFTYYIVDSLQIHGGAYYGFALDKYELKSGSTTIVSQDNNPDFGISAGVGVAFDQLNVDLTYKLGMADNDKTDSGERKWSSISLGVGYIF